MCITNFHINLSFQVEFNFIREALKIIVKIFTVYIDRNIKKFSTKKL